MSDVVTSIGVLVGLIGVLLTGYAILDPILAIMVAVNILWQGWKVISRSVDGLMDKAVDPQEDEAIKQAIAENAHGSLGVHYLRTRQAGAVTFVAFDLVVPAGMTVVEAHVICDRLEAAVMAVLPGGRRGGPWRGRIGGGEKTMSKPDFARIAIACIRRDRPIPNGCAAVPAGITVPTCHGRG
eukprot:gene38464-51967_t